MFDFIAKLVVWKVKKGVWKVSYEVGLFQTPIHLVFKTKLDAIRGGLILFEDQIHREYCEVVKKLIKKRSETVRDSNFNANKLGIQFRGYEPDANAALLRRRKKSSQRHDDSKQVQGRSTPDVLGKQPRNRGTSRGSRSSGKTVRKSHAKTRGTTVAKDKATTKSRLQQGKRKSLLRRDNST